MILASLTRVGRIQIRGKELEVQEEAEANRRMFPRPKEDFSEKAHQWAQRMITNQLSK